jgi:hypothetical protein
MNQDLTHIQKGAVVSCYFPLTENPNEPGPVARPALVVQVFFDRIERIWKAVLAYGTSRRTRANTGYEVRMNREDSLIKAGLHRPTRFTLSRMRILPLDKAFFDFNGDTPVLGYLDDGLIGRLDKTLEIISEIAAPLRPLLSAGGANVSIQHVAGKEKGPRPPDGVGISGLEIDRFMQENLTGRARQVGKQRHYG